MNKYEEGKVYLRDVRTGQIHLYERILEQNKNFETHIPNPVKVDNGDKIPVQDTEEDGDKIPVKDSNKADA